MTTAVSEWGPNGARAFDGQAGVMIVVDVLSFSTCVDIAVGRGASVYPFAFGAHTRAVTTASLIGAEIAGPRGDRAYRYSLSPVSLTAIPKGTKLILPSPNGSAISTAVKQTPLLAGCLRNARAVARRAITMAQGRPIAVIPAGERWPDGSLRPAIEDLLGAGAILHELDVACSPEAEVARAAFRVSCDRVADLIRASVSGQELIGRGYPEDVELALALNFSDAAPVLSQGAFQS